MTTTVARRPIVLFQILTYDDQGNETETDLLLESKVKDAFIRRYNTTVEETGRWASSRPVIINPSPPQFVERAAVPEPRKSLRLPDSFQAGLLYLLCQSILASA